MCFESVICKQTFLSYNNIDFQDCKTVLTVYISVNSVCWTLINKNDYEVVEWQYYGIDYPEGKKIQITDIFDIVSTINYVFRLAIN